MILKIKLDKCNRAIFAAKTRKYKVSQKENYTFERETKDSSKTEIK